MGKYLLGEFEHLVLLAILALGDNAYGVSVTRELESRTQKDVAQAATYLTLRRLEEKGWIAGATGEATVTRGGRVKRYYHVTPDGLEKLKESRETLLSMWSAIGELS